MTRLCAKLGSLHANLTHPKLEVPLGWSTMVTNFVSYDFLPTTYLGIFLIYLVEANLWGRFSCGEAQGSGSHIGPNTYQTDHGLQTPDETFFQQYPKLLGQLGRWA